MTLALLLLAADAASPGIWGQPVVLALIGVVGVLAGALATVMVKRMNKSVDDATALKTHVEADKMRAETELTRVTSDGKEVEIARGLLDDIRKELDRYRAEMDRVRTESALQIQGVIETNAKQHEELSAQLQGLRGQQDELRAQLEEHIPWDVAAQQLLHEMHPEFPAPPPIGHDRT